MKITSLVAVYFECTFIFFLELNIFFILSENILLYMQLPVPFPFSYFSLVAIFYFNTWEMNTMYLCKVQYAMADEIFR